MHCPWPFAALLVVSWLASPLLQDGPTVYLTELLDDTASMRQGWGNTGIDTAAYGALAPAPLRIKDRDYARGVGTHAPGEITVDLERRYVRFEAEAGVQWQQGTTGSVVFRVYVDGRKRFDSGRMLEATPARPVRVDLRGADELRLVVTDAGDGITCDGANWAEARLTLAAGAQAPTAPSGLDVGPFARVIGTDPARTTGARANRVQEYDPADLLMDLDLPREAAGWPVRTQQGRATIGLRWPERRVLREVGLQFAGAAPQARDVQVQGWFGESLYQGEWRPLGGTLKDAGRAWQYALDPASAEMRAGIRKVRWVWTGGPATVRSASAIAHVDARETPLRLELSRPTPGQSATVAAYNGYVGLHGSAPDGLSVPWEPAVPLRLTVRHARPRRGRAAEGAVLRLSLPSGPVAVAVNDVVANGRVWVPDVGLTVTLDRAAQALEPRQLAAQYARQARSRKTVLARVRTMPEQTLTQALARTRNPRQDLGPVLLSLAADNRKFEVSREGAVRFERRPEAAVNTPDTPLADAATLTCAFGAGPAAFRSRSIADGWLPAPVHAYAEGDVTYRERVFVAPTPLGPVCAVEVEATNGGRKPAAARVAVAVAAGDTVLAAPVAGAEGLRAYVQGGRLLACADLRGALPLRAATEGGAVTLTGDLPAGASARAVVRLPGWAAAPSDASRVADLPGLWDAFRIHWEGQLAAGARLEIPDQRLADIVRANEVHCLLAARSEGGGARIAPWIASMHYGPLESEANSIIRGMDMLGHHAFARRALDYFIARYNPQGFLTTGYTLMGTGWHLWALGEHFARTGNADWMRAVAPEVERVCAWITRQRAGNQAPELRDSPVRGLMPPGVQADWNAFSYWFALNAYYYAGMQHAAEALRAIGRPGAEAILTDAAAFRADILEAYRRVEAVTPVYPLQDGTWVRPYPSQADLPGPTGDYFPGEDGNRSWAYDVELGAHHLAPLGVFAYDSPVVTRISEHMEDVHFLGEGWFDYPAAANQKDWFNLGGFAKVQPYYARNGEIYAQRGDVKPFIRTYFNSLAAMLNTEVLSLWEHFSASGAWNKTHETGYFLQHTALMLATERGPGLWLAALTPAGWAKDGQSYGAEGLPTRWGPVSYRVTSHAAEGWAEATVTPPARGKPGALYLVLRHPRGHRLKAVQVNGVKHTDFDRATGAVRLPAGNAPLKVRGEFAAR